MVAFPSAADEYWATFWATVPGREIQLRQVRLLGITLGMLGRLGLRLAARGQNHHQAHRSDSQYPPVRRGWVGDPGELHVQKLGGYPCLAAPAVKHHIGTHARAAKFSTQLSNPV